MSNLMTALIAVVLFLTGLVISVVGGGLLFLNPDWGLKVMGLIILIMGVIGLLAPFELDL